MSERHEVVLDLPDAIQLALRLHRERRLDAAREVYQQLLRVAPEHPDLLHFYGIFQCQSGAVDDGIARIRRAIALVPDFVDFHVNLGNVLLEARRIDEAEAEYHEALRLDPGCARAWNNLGAIHDARAQPAEAEQAYLKAIELDPRLTNAHNNLGLIRWQRGDIEGAIECCGAAIGIAPEDPDGHRFLGIVYATHGLPEKAAEAFRRWVELDPDNPAARHHYAAVCAEQEPDRASDEYVSYTFDRFAASFEEKLRNDLQYRAPDRLKTALEDRLPPPGGQFEILDAGCGTGLCGPLLAPWRRRLIGVDLSAGMLEQARTKGCYDDLHQAELTAWLHSTAQRFDVIVSADTLCYFGPLDKVFAAAGSALVPGGMLAFTVERLTDPAPGATTRLSANGRYQHDPDYVARALAENGFTAVEVEPVDLRLEGGHPVRGLVATAVRSR
ncbi:MAG: tetratricopeptide repeat protein [Rhodocyclaceae bacterium]|nr:tetratricopeptide repeat protein [Rhodocyclaceae bacterium]